MGEASCCLLTPCPGPPLSPFSPLSPMQVPHCPLLPKVSLMLTCKKFLEMLPFLFRSNLSTGKSLCKANLNPVADFPLVTPGGMSRHLSPCGLHLRSKVEFSKGLALGPWGPRALPSSSRTSGHTLHEVWVAPVISLVPFILFSAIVASPMSQATATRSSLIPRHQHSPLGVVATVLDSVLCSGPFTG